MSKKYKTWLQVTTLCFFCNIPTYAASLPETIKRVKPSVVAVGTVHPTRSPQNLFMGTGFAVSDGSYVITNEHVIPKKIDKNKREQLAVFSGRGEKVSVRYAVTVATDKGHDLALLKITGNMLPPFKLSAKDNLIEGKEYAFTGYPIGTVLGLYPVTHRGIISAITPIVIPAAASSKLSQAMIKRMRDPYDVIQLDATAYPGNSGSPVYDPATGEVIGIINKVFVKYSKENAIENPSGITYAIPVKYIHALLKRAGL